MKAIFKQMLRLFVIVACVPTLVVACSDDDETTATGGSNSQSIASITAVSGDYYQGLPSFVMASSYYVYSEGVFESNKTASSIELSYRISPADASIDGIEWGLIRREFTTRAEGDDTSFSGVVEVTKVSDYTGEILVTIADEDGFLTTSNSTGENTYALVAKYSETKEIVSDFGFLEQTENVSIEVSEVKLQYDGADMNSSIEDAITSAINITSLTQIIDTPMAWGFVYENWLSFETLGFEPVINIAKYNGYDADSFTLANVDGKWELTINDEMDVDAKDRTIIILVSLTSSSEEDAICNYYIAFTTTMTTSEEGTQIIDGTDADGDQYYVDSEITVDGLMFPYWEEGYGYSFEDGLGYTYEGITITWGEEGAYGFMIDPNVLKEGSNTIRLILTKEGSRTYIYTFVIIVLPTPTITEPTLTINNETYGQLYGGIYEMGAPLSNIISGGYTNDDYVTYEISLIGENSTKATFAKDNSSTTVISGYLKNLSSDLKEYRIKLNSSLSNESLDVDVVVNILRSGVTSLTSDTGSIMFKNPIYLTTGFSYAMYDGSCDMSEDVVVLFKTDSTPEGIVVYEEGANTALASTYGISVSYTTDEAGFYVSGNNLVSSLEESLYKYSYTSFNVSVQALSDGSRYASASQSYIDVIIEQLSVVVK